MRNGTCRNETIVYTLAISNRLTWPGNFDSTADSRGVRYKLSLVLIPPVVPYLHKYSKHLYMCMYKCII